MGIVEIFLIASGLAMDAFAVSVCKGLSMKKLEWKKAVVIAIYFGIFQGLMPLLGYFLGSTFESVVTQVDHWISFILLTLIGGNMVKDSFSKDKINCNDDVDFRTMIVLAIATSIDALAVGITFAFFDINIMFAVSIIIVVTFIISLLGVKIGNSFGDKYENRAEFIGGIILVLMGIKILFEHLNLL